MKNTIRTGHSTGNKPGASGMAFGVIGQAAAWFTILLWGTTFVSIKILLVEFNPAEILLFRFIMGYFALFLACPRRLKSTGIRQEAVFALAGLCGICLYYLLENIALTYTMASNVGVVVSVSPFFTAMLVYLLKRRKDKASANGQEGQEGFGVHFLLGFFVAMAGVVLISFNGSRLELNPVGDILALVAAFSWACYSLLTRKIAGYGYPVILTTRRTFFYGILFMLPSLLFYDFSWNLERFSRPANLFNILYLGLGASAMCFVTWNVAVKHLGAVRTSVYIYLVPVITVVTSAWILNEPVTWITAAGTFLAIAGLFLSNL